MLPSKRKLPPKASRLTKQIKRAKELARISVGPVAELYLLHAEICEKKRGSKDRARRLRQGRWIISGGD